MQGNSSTLPLDTDLERGLTMNAPLTTTQVILIAALLGFLLAWIVTFAVLALRSNTSDVLNSGEQTDSIDSLPVNHASTMLHMIVPLQGAAGRQDTGEMKEITVV